jgi:hypothetical protein
VTAKAGSSYPPDSGRHVGYVVVPWELWPQPARGCGLSTGSPAKRHLSMPPSRRFRRGLSDAHGVGRHDAEVTTAVGDDESAGSSASRSANSARGSGAESGPPQGLCDVITAIAAGTAYSVAVSKSRCTAAKRAAGSSSFRQTAAQTDQLRAATRAKSSRFNAAAVTRNVGTIFEEIYRRYPAGLPLDHFMAEQRAPALHAASSAELCS